MTGTWLRRGQAGRAAANTLRRCLNPAGNLGRASAVTALVCVVPKELLLGAPGVLVPELPDKNELLGFKDILGHPSWLQTPQISLANSPGFISVKFHISVLCVHLRWG